MIMAQDLLVLKLPPSLALARTDSPSDEQRGSPPVAQRELAVRATPLQGDGGRRAGVQPGGSHTGALDCDGEGARRSALVWMRGDRPRPICHAALALEALRSNGKCTLAGKPSMLSD